MNTIRVSNSVDPDQDRHSVGPDLGPNCLQRLSRKLPLARLELNCRLNHSALRKKFLRIQMYEILYQIVGKD